MSVGEPHPQHPGLRCEHGAPNHPICTGYQPGVGYRDWPNPLYEAPRASAQPASRRRGRLDELAGRVRAAQRPAAGPDADTGTSVGLAAAGAAADTWSPAERALVLTAVTDLAARRAEFTADDVWAVLGDSVPRRNALGAVLSGLARQGRIARTDRKVDVTRAGLHYQLTVWRSPGQTVVIGPACPR